MRLWGNWNTHTFLVEMKCAEVVMDNNSRLAQIIKHGAII